MKTSKSLIEENKIELDIAFQKKYPNGRYAIKIDRKEGYYHCDIFSKKVPTKEEIENNKLDIFLVKEKFRRTGAYSFKAVVVTNRKDSYDPQPYREFYTEPFLNNTWGCIRFFDNRDKFLACARKWNIPEAHIDAFLSLDIY